jgi:transmembrane sensor
LKNLAALGNEVDEDLLDPNRWSELPDEKVTAEPPVTRHAPRSTVVDLASHRSEPHELHQQGLRALGAEPRESHRLPRLSARGSRMAASFIVALVLAAGGVFAGYKLVDRQDVETYTTAVGEFRRIPLSDGSVLGLNTDSVVRVDMSGTHRVVELQRGEALFTVAHDATRPFDVHSGAVVVRAVGTQFSVRKRDETSADVLVSEGRISINPPSSSTFGMGSYMKVRNGRISTTLLPANDITDRLWWVTTQRLTVKGATVSEVVAELNRYNVSKIVIQAPGLAEQNIGGTFRTGDPEGFVSALERIAPIRVRHLTRGSEEIISVEKGGTP